MGSALLVEEEPVHVAFFRSEDGEAGEEGGRMAGLRRRRSFRSGPDAPGFDADDMTGEQGPR